MTRHHPPPLRCSSWPALAILLACGLAITAHSASPILQDDTPRLESRVYLQIAPEGAEELEALFATLEASVAADEPQQDPVVVVLNGPEANRFLRRNYLENQPLVDRAAKLRAFDRIDLRMCETWMHRNGVVHEDLLPFIDTVPLAPQEVERLEREGYLPFSPVRPANPLL